MHVNTIVNRYRNANTHIIVNAENDRVILIDLGGPEIDKIVTWLDKNEKIVDAVILTHEHADHCIGVNSLHNLSPFKIFGSSKCLANIKDPRQNFSIYTDEIPTFEIHLEGNAVGDGDYFDVNGYTILGIETPGHSPGSMCFLIEDALFTGDTVLNGVKTPLNFPHSSREAYRDSLSRLDLLLPRVNMIYPGHGSAFPR